jgi:hypothetical protein
MQIITICYFFLGIINTIQAQAPAQSLVMSPGSIHQNKFGIFDTNQLTSINAQLESKRNKNFTIDVKSLHSGSDLSSSKEHDLKINYGIKSLFGGVLGVNATNNKSFNNAKPNDYLGMSYNLTRSYSSLSFNFKNSDTLNTQYKGVATQVFQLDYKSKF